MRVTILPVMIAIVVALSLLLQAGAPATQAPDSNTAPKGNAENGKKAYLAHGCWTCHGTVAHGGGGSGPRLAGRLAPWPAFSKYVRQPTDEMIPYTAKVISDQTLADIYAWLRSIPPPPPVSSIPGLRN